MIYMQRPSEQVVCPRNPDHGMAGKKWLRGEYEERDAVRVLASLISSKSTAEVVGSTRSEKNAQPTSNSLRNICRNSPPLRGGITPSTGELWREDKDAQPIMDRTLTRHKGRAIERAIRATLGISQRMHNGGSEDERRFMIQAGSPPIELLEAKKSEDSKWTINIIELWEAPV
jgi:hypothetical protein